MSTTGHTADAGEVEFAAQQDERLVRVTQTRSSIGTKPKHRSTLRALGLRRIGASNVLPDRPEIRGMLARVPHLVAIEAAAPGERHASRAVGKASSSSAVDASAVSEEATS